MLDGRADRKWPCWGGAQLRVGPRARVLKSPRSTHHTFLGRPRYRYRLLGFASEWVDTQGQNFTVYQNLPPGQYTYEVNAGLPDGRWSAHRSTLRLQVTGLSTGPSVGLSGAGPAVLAGDMRHLKQQSQTGRLLESQEEERKRIAASCAR